MRTEDFSVRPCTLVYLVLVTLTVTTYLVGVAGVSGLAVALSVLLLALVKGFLIGDYYMELGGLKGPWRWVVLVWLLLPGGLIAIAFTISG